MCLCVCKSARILDRGCMHVKSLWTPSFTIIRHSTYTSNTSFYLYVYTVHNQAIQQPLMNVEIEIQLLCFPNTAIVYTLSRALSGL